MKVSLKDLSFCSGKTKQLDRLNFEINSGQCLVISGDSGSGKSLLLNLISGLVEPDSGQISFNQIPLKQMSNKQETVFRKQLSVIFQVPALLSNLTLFENLALPLLQHKSELGFEQRQQLIIDICAQFNLQGSLNERVEQLSNGSQSLASLARALVSNPELLLWDTALSGIDLKWHQKIILILKTMKQQNKTIILFTNKQRLIDELADVHLHLKDSHLCAPSDIN